MRLYKWGIIGLCLLLFFLAGYYLFYSFYVVEEVTMIPADVYISESKMGFNADKDMLYFGIVPKKGSSSLRFIEVKNERDYPVEILVKSGGEIKGWLFSYLKGDKEVRGPYLLEPGEKKEIALGLVPGEEAEVDKQYTGKVKVITKKLGY